jgi:molybdenum cofactor cytidylyltransferase
VLQHVLDTAAASYLDEIVVVLGHAGRDIAARIRLPARTAIVLNQGYAQGQSASLRAGLQAARLEAAAAVILLGDQPGIRPEAIDAVVQAWRAGNGPVVRASYEGRPDHPTLFDRSVWAELVQIQGDEGARGLLEAHQEWRTTAEVGGPAPQDIDTEEDYARAKAAFDLP